MARKAEPVCTIEPDCWVTISGGVDAACVGTGEDLSCYSYELELCSNSRDKVVCDATTGAYVPVGIVCCDNLGKGGCFTTCKLPLNSNHVDPDGGVLTSYKFRLYDGHGNIVVSEQFILHEDDVACGDDLQIKDLTTPPGDGTTDNIFCRNIQRCLPDLQLISPDGSITTNVTGDWATGWVFEVEDAASSQFLGDVTGSTVSLAHIPGDGEPVTMLEFDICALMDEFCPHPISSLSIVENGSVVSYTFDPGDGSGPVTTDIDFCALIAANCSDSLVPTVNADGSVTYLHTAIDGTEVPFTIPASSVVAPLVTGNVIATHTDGFGNTVNIEESVTVIVDDPAAGTFTYTNEAGVDVTVDYCNCPDGSLTLTDGVLTYTASDGNVYDIPLPVSVVAQVVTGNQIATHTDGNGNVVSIEESISTIVDNGGTFDYTNEAGDTVNVDFCDCPDGAISVAGSVITYTGSDGATSTADVCAIIDAECPETVTELVLAADGLSFTYTNEDGVDVVVPLATPELGGAEIVDNTDNTSTVTATDVDGNVTTGTVINNLLVNDGAYGTSRDIDPAADVLLTEEQPHDPAGWDYCGTLEEFGCPVYKSAVDGKFYTTPTPEQNYLYGATTGQIQGTMDLTDPANNGFNNTDYIYYNEQCRTITNNTACQLIIDLEFAMNQKIRMRLGSTVTVQAVMEFSIDGGASWSFAFNGLPLGMTHNDTAQPNITLQTSTANSRHLPRQAVLDCGESVDLCFRLGHRMTVNQLESDSAFALADLQGEVVIGMRQMCGH